LHSAFANLASNAVRYTPAGGHIEIGWRLEQQGAVYWVRDDGIGIDPAHIPRLTERFYRVDRGRSRETGGTGLGLAIVKHIVTRHQGELRVSSELGKGSVFEMRFPAPRLRIDAPE
jgi:two-component system, OmpR family, phosphate regulon sensor histidine kinase PhoR